MLLRMVKEARKGYITGTDNQAHYQLNLLCVPKKDNTTKLMTNIRVARHGSFARGYSVPINKKIDRDKCKIPTIPNIPKYINKLIKFNYVSLRDLKDAFRQMLLAREDTGFIQYCLFGLRFTDNRQAYGVASAAANCQHFAQILIWICENKYLSPTQRDRLLVHIDDFLIASVSENEAIEMANRFDQMCDDLNVTVSHEKDETAIRVGVVHGFGFNLITKFVNIPDIKYHELMRAIALILKFRYLEGSAFESLCGKLMHWSQLRKPAKVLCYRMLGFIFKHIRKNPKYKRHIFWVHDQIAQDLRFWQNYAYYMRSVSMQSVLNNPSITITAATDASSFGGGMIVGPHYAKYRMSDVTNRFGINHKQMHINKQEAHAVIMLLHNFRKELTGRNVLLYIDNQPVRFCIFKYWSGSADLMEYIQEIVLLMCVYNIGLKVHYIPSDYNTLPDALSRFEMNKFHQAVYDYNLSFDDHETVLEYYPILKLMRTGL